MNKTFTRLSAALCFTYYIFLSINAGSLVKVLFYFKRVIILGVLGILASRNYISVNKRLISLFGIDCAVLLGELASEYEYYEQRKELIDGCFYSTVSNIEINTGLSAHQQRQAFKVLQDMNIVTVEKKGIPARRYIRINEEQVVELFNHQSLKNCTTGDSKIEQQEIKKFNGNKNKEIINKNNNKKAYGEFNNVMLTDEEYAKVKERGLTPLIEELSGYLENLGAKGKSKYNSHYATLLAWGRRRQAEKPKDGKMKREPSFDIDELKRKAELEDDYDI